MCPQKPEEINSDRFYLLFGICIEALSNRRSADLTLGEVGSCLKALKALLDHVWTRTEVLSKVHLLLIELCNVLHRTILTRDSPTVHLLAMEVLKLVLATTKVCTYVQKVSSGSLSQVCKIHAWNCVSEGPT